MGHNFYIYYNDVDLKKLVEVLGTTDKTQVKKLIKEKSMMDFSDQQVNLSSKQKMEDLKRMKLTLECWKGLMEIRDYVPFKIDPIAILKGEATLEPPQLTMLNNGNVEQENIPSPNKISWTHYCTSVFYKREREFSELVFQCRDCGVTKQ